AIARVQLRAVGMHAPFRKRARGGPLHPAAALSVAVSDGSGPGGRRAGRCLQSRASRWRMTTPPTTPRVSFVVPCYKLAHLLRDCVESILSQSYRDVEVLIMDDCSPDDTPSVAASFDDSRVRSIRNPVNLGHVRNYNEGIRLSRGEYVWIMS